MTLALAAVVLATSAGAASAHPVRHRHHVAHHHVVHHRMARHRMRHHAVVHHHHHHHVP
jgi:hypothetical protein